MKFAIEQVNVIAELERLGVKWESIPGSKSEVKTLCPAHSESNPSCTVNTESRFWYCHSCKNKGDIVGYFAHKLKAKRDVVIRDFSKRYTLEEVKEISAADVEDMHQKIWKAGPLLQALYDRGLTDDMIRRGRLGFHEGRIMIPVPDEHGRILNIRKYLPGAPTEKKMMNTRGFGKVRLYIINDIIKNNAVVICGGEMKALVVSSLLKDHKIGACSPTAGEGSWNLEWNPLFSGKKVFILLDVDSAGVSASKKLAEILYSVAKEVRIVTLPLNKEKYPKGDINDWVAKEKATAEDILNLLQASPIYEPGNVHEEPERGLKTIKLEKIGDPENIGWQLEFECIVSASDTTPYLVPKEIAVSCTRDQPACAICPIKREDPDNEGFVIRHVAPNSSSIVSLVNCPKSSQTPALRDALKIPNCKVVEFSVRSHYSVSDVRLSPQLAISSEGAGNINQAAFIVNGMPDMNIPYLVRGKVYPSPRTQQAVVVINEFEETSDSLSTFSPQESELEALKIFQPAENQSVKEKLDEIYSDLSCNVTRIFGRTNLHVMYDMVYHSPLQFEFGQKLVNGWVNGLVLGDSSQGKSEVIITLLKHYDLGEKVECKNASIAGLLGGLEQVGSKWFVKWGIIPAHDRRMVALEEVKGTPIETIGKLTDMRSSGVAEIPKIERRRAQARTRLLWISNPRSSRPIASYSFGLEAILELIGSLEDVRRFDICVVLAADQVKLDKMKLETVPHRYTSELCRRLILWSWTRKPEQVKFTLSAQSEIKKYATKLTEMFTEAIPLIDKGTVSHKLARLSAAIAARLFSREGDTLVVDGKHVEFVGEYIEEEYSRREFGYKEYTRAQTSLNNITDPKALTKFLLKETKHPRALIEGLLYRDDITLLDVQDWCEADRDVGTGILSFLVRMHAIKRVSRNSYQKTEECIALLRKIGIPDHTKEKDDDM